MVLFLSVDIHEGVELFSIRYTRSQFSQSVLIPLALYVYVAVCQGDTFIVFINVQHLQFCEQATQRCVFKVFYPKFSVHKVIISASLVYIFSVYLSM